MTHILLPLVILIIYFTRYPNHIFQIIIKVFFSLSLPILGAAEGGAGAEGSSGVSRGCWYPTVADGVGHRAGWSPPLPWGKWTLAYFSPGPAMFCRSSKDNEHVKRRRRPDIISWWNTPFHQFLLQSVHFPRPGTNYLGLYVPKLLFSVSMMTYVSIKNGRCQSSAQGCRFTWFI